MKVFAHHVYEYRKGLRNLVLHTTLAEHREAIEARLSKYAIDYVIYPLGNGRVNVFFGAQDCVETIRRIGKIRLSDYTAEEDFMLGIMLGYDRLAQCRRYLIRSERRRPLLPACQEPGVWQGGPAPARLAFTLIELLIVIGLLGALASVMLSNYSVNRKESLDNSIVQKELADIQKAFQQFNADCVPQKDDHALAAKYGLAVLMKFESGNYLQTGEGWSFGNNPDNAAKCWRGPYIECEGSRTVDPTSVGQRTESGTVPIPVVKTPDSRTDTDMHYYRVVATITNGSDEQIVSTPADVAALNAADSKKLQLWIVAPEGGSIPLDGVDITVFPEKFRRRLLLDRE